MAETKTEQWTPEEPWQIFKPFITDAGGNEIATVWAGNSLGTEYSSEVIEWHFSVLRAAPELYTALKNLVARYDEAEINAAIAALAKARGESR